MDQRSKIAILGYGVEGRAVFDYLHSHGFGDLTICDQNVDLKDELPDGVSARLGENYLKDLDDFEVVFRSPGIKYLDPHIQAAVNSGVEVTSCTGFFIDQCPCPVIGITGTKGKGTTATLIYLMLKASGRDVYSGGNIGNPPISFLDDLKKDSIVVLELSSFQLQDLKKSPKYAVLLNTTSDHLDYHADVDEYLAAKEQLLNSQNEDGVAVLNKDYEYVKQYLPLVKGKKYLVSMEEKVSDGSYLSDGWICYAKGAKEEKIAEIAKVKLIGSHNLENIMPAVVVAKELGVADKEIKGVIETFEGLPNRLEFVKELNGVKYYNDSFSTTPETSMAAVDSFDEPTILIAGGSDKQSDFSDWALKILTKESLKTVILIGDTAEIMEQALVDAEDKLGEAEGSPTKIIRRGSLDDAVLAAYAEADEGYVVVMSPAAASFDMFKNYKERGKSFINLVKKLR